MTRRFERDLSRRERQIMDYLFQQGSGTAADVLANLPNPPGYSAVRATLKILESKGYVRHYADGPRYVYEPTTNRKTAQRSALRHLVSTFFDDSISQVASALLNLSDGALSHAELDRVAELVEQARRSKQ
jgi:predicted transcriptional regulator